MFEELKELELLEIDGGRTHESTSALRNIIDMIDFRSNISGPNP